MKIDGGCHCGAITYEAEIDSERVVVCHCSDCQTLSGAAFRSVAFTREGTFRLLSGEVKEYVKTAESGNRRAQGFCGDCGTPIYSTSLGDGRKTHGLRVGSVRQRDVLVPKRQVWLRSARHWVGDLGSVPGVERQ